MSGCSLKSNLDKSKIIARCLWYSVELTVLWLKIKHGWFVLWNNGLSIKTCGVPASIPAHGVYCPFTTTL